ncbi:hypothetical protein PIB30_080764 [Stylosanthes scabra]|uniref:Uncharacterized protein n=1 Tax=Stylosanthes scabra TaxID=79078 RepID=A0ABU6YU92_9FABA|nr:hypothetical protein [Stylosanthes scabra]
MSHLGHVSNVVPNVTCSPPTTSPHSHLGHVPNVAPHPSNPPLQLTSSPTFPRTITRRPPHLTTITHLITFGPRLKHESNVSLHPTPTFLRSPHMVPFFLPTLDYSSSPRGPRGSHSRDFTAHSHAHNSHNPSPHSRSHPHDSLPYPTKSFSPNPYLHIRASSFHVALTYPHSLLINCHSPFALHHRSNQSFTSLCSLFLHSHTQSQPSFFLRSPTFSLHGILIKEKKTGKQVVTDEEFDAQRFKTAFHQQFHNSYVASKDIISDTRFNLEEGEFPKIEQQIELRGWKRLAKPKLKVGQSIIREFYANARINEDADEEQPY